MIETPYQDEVEADFDQSKNSFDGKITEMVTQTRMKSNLAVIIFDVRDRLSNGHRQPIPL